MLLIRQSDSGAPVCVRMSRRMADTLNTNLAGSVRALYKQKLQQLGHTTSRRLAGERRLIAGRHFDNRSLYRVLSYGRSCDRKNDLLPILQNITVTDTSHHHQHRPHL